MTQSKDTVWSDEVNAWVNNPFHKSIGERAIPTEEAYQPTKYAYYASAALTGLLAAIPNPTEGQLRAAVRNAGFVAWEFIVEKG